MPNHVTSENPIAARIRELTDSAHYTILITKVSTRTLKCSKTGLPRFWPKSQIELVFCKTLVEVFNEIRSRQMISMLAGAFEAEVYCGNDLLYDSLEKISEIVDDESNVYYRK
jgi:hypothetical protein